MRIPRGVMYILAGGAVLVSLALAGVDGEVIARILVAGVQAIQPYPVPPQDAPGVP